MEDALLMDFKMNLLSKSKLIANYWFLVEKLLSFFKKNSIDTFFIFNGYAQYIEYTARLVGKFMGCKNVFFEIGNFPNKIFVDLKGVNAASSLMDIDLREMPCDLANFKKFMKKYLESKEKVHFVPQSLRKENIFRKIIDHDRFEPSIFVRVKNFINNYLLKPKIDFDKLPNKDFLFFPLQVSYDSQILRFSKIDLFDAIDIASKEAKRKGLVFVVKPHPAELNYNIIDYARNKGAIVVNDNTYQLLKKSTLVYTINSTVGLESFFYNKPLVVLGEAFYKKYTDDNYENKLKVLCNYINNILVNGSYFDENVKFDKKILRYLKVRDEISN
jgi:capsular polysaccharide export protein